MKKVYSLLFFFSFIVLAAVAQDDNMMIVEAGPVGTLNDAINGDTTATGDRMNPDRIYVLRRGVPYVLSAQFEYEDYHLQIHAEEGDGTRPLLISDTGDDGLSQYFRTRGNASLTLDGLHISGEDILGQFVLRGIRINSDSSTIHINDCLIENIGQAGIRVQGDNSRIYITNSILRNMGRPANPDNGRMIDNRGNPIDTLWIENSLMYNVTSRYYRNGSGASIDWARINQNTFGGSGQQGFTFDDVTNLEFTNNLAMNTVFLGQTAAQQDTLEDASFVVEIDTFESTKNILIANNNFHLDQELIDTLPPTNAMGDSLLSMDGFLFNAAAQAAIDASGVGDTNIDEAVEFANPAPAPVQFLLAAAQDTSAGSEIPAAMDWDFSNLEADAIYSAIGMGAISRYSDIHDYSYTGGASATGGTEGQALGWGVEAGTTSAKDFFVAKNILYYPNPVQGELFIQNLDNENLDRIMISDLTGKLISDIRGINSAIHNVQLGHLTKGTYLLSIIGSDGKMDTRKVVKL